MSQSLYVNEHLLSEVYNQTAYEIYESKGPFTVSVCVRDCDIASKWVPLISMELFTVSDTKHQRKKSQTQSLTVNRP